MKNLFHFLSCFIFLSACNLCYAQEPHSFKYGPCPTDYPVKHSRSSNGCWQLFAHIEPSDYIVRYCQDGIVPVKEKRCRFVPKYYIRESTKEIPDYCITNLGGFKEKVYAAEYCSETVCCLVPEEYEEEGFKKELYIGYEVKRGCKPIYYWKRVCNHANCPTKHPLIVYDDPIKEYLPPIMDPVWDRHALFCQELGHPPRLGRFP